MNEETNDTGEIQIMPKYDLILSAVFNHPWAILQDKFTIIAELLALRASGERLAPEEIQARLGAAPRPTARTSGAVAVVPVLGIISHRMNLMSQMSGGTSTEQLTKQLRSHVNNPEVKAIVLDIDSPGGTVPGIQELASEIIEMRDRKHIVAVANTLAASAAYWIGAAASEFVVTPSGQVGSIGVIAAHEDLSKALEQQGVNVSLISAGKFKTEGSPLGPLSDEARAAMQARVDETFNIFVNAVAKGRGVSVSAVRNGFGQGRVVGAREALSEGMADRIATLDETLSRLGATNGPSSNERAQDAREISTRRLNILSS